MKFNAGWIDKPTEEDWEALKKQREQEDVLDLICSLGNWLYGFILKVLMVINLGIVTAALLKCF